MVLLYIITHVIPNFCLFLSICNRCRDMNFFRRNVQINNFGNFLKNCQIFKVYCLHIYNPCDPNFCQFRSNCNRFRDKNFFRKNVKITQKNVQTMVFLHIITIVIPNFSAQSFTVCEIVIFGQFW